jgi:hypothetical protein
VTPIEEGSIHQEPATPATPPSSDIIWPNLPTSQATTAK